MNYLDIIIAVPLLYGLIKGFSNGLIKEVSSFSLLMVAGVYIAINFSEFLEPKVVDVLGGGYEAICFGILPLEFCF